MKTQIAVIGAGHAGVEAALASARLGIEYHIKRGACFDRAADVEPLELYEDLCIIGTGHIAQPDYRRIADSVKYGAANHIVKPFGKNHFLSIVS